MLQPKIAYTTKEAISATGLNKNVIVKDLASVGVFRFKPEGNQYLYLGSDLVKGMEALRMKYIREAAQATQLMNEKKFV